MNLKQHYNNLYNTSIIDYKNDSYYIDPLIDSTSDTRYGLTLLIKPPISLTYKITKFLEQVKKVEPNQYYYPESDMHITVMSVISCYEGFNLSKITLKNYVDLIRTCLSEINTFTLEFKGLTASPSCIMVQGFLKDETLTQIRNNLRTHFKRSDLQHSIDKRYPIKTAHSTVIRIREKFQNKESFLSIIEQYRDYDFGSFSVDSMELVFNDWYQKENEVSLLHRFSLAHL